MHGASRHRSPFCFFGLFDLFLRCMEDNLNINCVTKLPRRCKSLSKHDIIMSLLCLPEYRNCSYRELVRLPKIVLYRYYRCSFHVAEV